MQARNPTVKAHSHPEPTEDRGWLLATEETFAETEEERLSYESENEFAARREKRERVFRVAEYSPYPRVDRGQRRLTAFVRNESISGMCLVSDQAEPVGCCLRVGLQGVDGFPMEDTLARVVWTCRQADGRHWLGLSLLNPRSARRKEGLQAEARRVLTASKHETRAYFDGVTGRPDRKAS